MYEWAIVLFISRWDNMTIVSFGNKKHMVFGTNHIDFGVAQVANIQNDIDFRANWDDFGTYRVANIANHIEFGVVRVVNIQNHIDFRANRDDFGLKQVDFRANQVTNIEKYMDFRTVFIAKVCSIYTMDKSRSDGILVENHHKPNSKSRSRRHSVALALPWILS